MLLTGEASHRLATYQSQGLSLPLVSCGCQALEQKEEMYLHTLLPPPPQKDPKLSGESLWGAEQS